jgi:hypothetical protein
MVEHSVVTKFSRTTITASWLVEGYKYRTNRPILIMILSNLIAETTHACIEHDKDSLHNEGLES